MIEMMHRTMAVDTKIRGREIDVRAVPYLTPTTVCDNGQVYREQIDPEAFTVEKRRPNAVKLLRDHDVQRLIGSCTKVNPRPADGLHATARVNVGLELGRDSLALAEAGDLHVSIGFIPDPAFDVWDDDHTMVTRHSCILWEISLVPFPAYDDADVIAVRHGSPVTMTSNTTWGAVTYSNMTGTPYVLTERVADVPTAGLTSATPNLDDVRAWLQERSLTGQ